MYREVNPKEIKSGTINIREDIGDITPIIDKINARLAKGKSGIAVPLIVTEIDDAEYPYEVVDGERRLAGALEVGLEKVPIVIAEASVDETLSWDSFDANDARLGNNWYEIGKFFSRENKGGMTHEEIARRGGLGRTTVTYHINAYKALSNVPRGTKIDSIQTAKMIVDKGNPSDYQRIVDKVVEDNLSWRDTEKLLDKVNTIREKIYQVDDNTKREELFNSIEPIIYEDEVTVAYVDNLILKALGVKLNMVPVVTNLNQLVKKMGDFNQKYPDNSVYENWDDGDNYHFRIEAWIDTKVFRQISGNEGV